MTREDRWIVSLDEILAIRWTCPHCQAALSFQMDQSVRLPTSCPACHQDRDEAVDERAAEQFVRALKALRRAPPGRSLQLEFLAGPRAPGGS